MNVLFDQQLSIEKKLHGLIMIIFHQSSSDYNYYQNDLICEKL